MVLFFKLLGLIVLCAFGVIAVNLIAIWGVTREMTPEEKEEFLKSIEKDGILGNDEDFL